MYTNQSASVIPKKKRIMKWISVYYSCSSFIANVQWFVSCAVFAWFRRVWSMLWGWFLKYQSWCCVGLSSTVESHPDTQTRGNYHQHWFYKDSPIALVLLGKFQFATLQSFFDITLIALLVDSNCTAALTTCINWDSHLYNVVFNSFCWLVFVVTYWLIHIWMIMPIDS